MKELEQETREACGVFGIYAPGCDVARLSFFGLYALQHRGQESSGIATSDGEMAYMHKGMGLIAQVFNEQNMSQLRGHLAIGHTRYSTTGASHIRNVQPYLIETIYGPLGLGHNGNLTNAFQLRQALLKRGVGLSSTTDSEVIAQILASPPDAWSEVNMRERYKNGRREAQNGNGNGVESAHTNRPDHWVERIRALMQVAQGAYSLTILTRNAVYAVRDPYGLRPLCLGELDTGCTVAASESCALMTIGARYLRSVEPGEIVRLDEHGITSFEGMPTARRALCVFEYVYFSRPDSILEGQIVHDVRQRLGRQLAREAPADADIVFGVPDSATPAAIGYSQESGLSYTEGLTKNRYIGRTFIQPDAHLRQLGVHLKFNPLTANLQGKRVVLVDDSIVRGNTVGPLLQLLRSAGASEVHVRVSSPPVRHPCFMGVDMATYKELIAHHLDVESIRQRIGADSLAYLSLEGMLDVVQQKIGEHPPQQCRACFSGEYPIPIPEWLFADDREKMIFEVMWGN